MKDPVCRKRGMVELSIPRKSGYYFEEIQQQSLRETLFLGELYIAVMA